MKRLLRQLAENNYYSAKALWKRRQRRRMQAHGGDPIVNYQMGKVGSSTIQASLEALGLDRPVYHVHFLNPLRVREIERQRRSYFRTEKQALLRRPWLSEFLYEQIQQKNRRWSLITLVREPIARNISTFFENLDVRQKADAGHFTVSSDYYGFTIDVDLENLKPLVELFFERLVHERPLRYFDDEIRTVYGIDVFASAFPRDRGFMIHHGDNADLLLIRLENLDSCANTAFRAFLGIDDLALVKTNVASNKVYAPLYREFKRSIRLPQDYVDRMYDSKYTRHFYSDEEIQQFRQRWTAGQSV